MADTFDKNLDKITERETVYDFYERLPIGKDIRLDSSLKEGSYKFGSGTLLQDIIKQIMYTIPFPIADSEKIRKVRSFKLEVSKNKSGTFWTTAYGIYSKNNIIAAISTCTGLDLKNEIIINPSGIVIPSGSTVFGYNSDYIYDNDDIITIYCYK